MKINVYIVLFTVLLLGNLKLSAQLNRNYFEQGRFEFGKERYTEAIKLLNYALEFDNDIPDAWFFRGMSKYYIGDYVGAENDLTQCIDLSPYHKDAILYRAVIRNRLLNFEQAFSDFNRVIKLDSTDAYAYFQRAISHLSLNQFEKAIDDCNSSIDKKLNEISVYTIRGVAYANLKNYRQALNDFNTVLKKDPENYFTLIQKGNIYVKMQLNDSALLTFNHIIKQDSLNSLAIFSRAMLSLNEENYTSALSDMNKVLKISPHSTTARFNRAVIHSQLENIALAINDYSEVLKKHPDNILAWYNRAGLYAFTKQWEKAENDYTHAINLFPDYAEAYYFRSKVYLQLGKIDQAKHDLAMAESINKTNEFKSENLKHQQMMELQKLTTLDSDFINGNTIDKIQYQHSDIEPESAFMLIPDKLSALKLYYDSYPKKEYTKQYFAFINQYQNIDKQQLQNVIDSLSTMPDITTNAELLIYRACLYTLQENFNKAMEDYKIAETITPENPLLYFCRGTSYLMLGNFMNELNTDDIIYLYDENNNENLNNLNPNHELAINEFDKAINLDPGFEFAYFNRAVTYGLMSNHKQSIIDYSYAIINRENFIQAYFNRGLTKIFIGQNTNGCQDMSKAGELGNSKAYQIITNYCH